MPIRWYKIVEDRRESILTLIIILSLSGIGFHKPDLVLSSDLGVKPFTTSALVAKVIQFMTFIIGFPMALHGAYEKHIPARRVLEIYFLYFSSKTYVVGTITSTSSTASVAKRSILASLINRLFAYCKGGNFNIHIWAWLGYFIC